MNKKSSAPEWTLNKKSSAALEARRSWCPRKIENVIQKKRREEASKK